MNKFLSLVSLVLALIILMSVCVFADESENILLISPAPKFDVETAVDVPYDGIVYATTGDATNEEVVTAEPDAELPLPEGVNIIYANDISGMDAPVIDGEIKDGEYGKLSIKIKDHISYANSYPECDSQIDETRKDQPSSESFDFYFAYDENNIYVAFIDYGNEWEESSVTDEFLKSLTDVPLKNYTARNNYMVATGFLLDDLTSYISLTASSRGFDENAYYDLGSYGEKLQALEIANEIYLKKYLKSDPTKIISTYDGTSGSNPNSEEGPYIAVCEIKYSKQQLVDVINDSFFYDFTELPNAMWFYFLARSYVLKEDLSGTESLAFSRQAR